MRDVGAYSCTPLRTALNHVPPLLTKERGRTRTTYALKRTGVRSRPIRNTGPARAIYVPLFTVSLRRVKAGLSLKIEGPAEHWLCRAKLSSHERLDGGSGFGG
jgi:hypothetical protein